MKQILKFDITLQWRQGFWLVYFIVTFFYLVILFNIPEENRLYVSLLFIISDTSVLGVMFVGALVLLEKQQNVLQSLFVTPIKLRNYLLSKSISLGLISLVMSVLLYVLPNGIDRFFFFVMIVVISNSIIFTLIGLGLSVKVDSLNKYIALLVFSSIVIITPVVPFLILDQPVWLLFFPMNAAIDLIMMGLAKLSLIRIIADVLSLIVWFYLALIYAKRQFINNIYY
jgi:fluoroquinolone transport system permease protein